MSRTSTALLLACNLLAASAFGGPSVKIVELPDRLRVELNGELFTEYLTSKERYFPTFYPVLGPGETPMTRSYPFETIEGVDTDHPHHQSLWFAHSKVNGHNFWAVTPQKGTEPGRTVHQGFTSIESGEKEGGFVSENHYVASDGQVIFSDTRTVRFLAPTAPNAPRILDITIAFHASHGPIVFGDDKDAGMAIRVASDLQVERRSQAKPANGNLVNSEGVTGKETWGKRARWLDAYGEVAGKPVGIAILDHPSNPRHPTYWHSRTYGLVTANIFGKRFFESLEDPKAGEFTVPAGETRTFRWRFLFHEGDPVAAGIEEQFGAFAKE